MDIQQLINALRGSGGEQQQPASLGEASGEGGDMAGGAIAVTPEYRQYRHNTMLDGGTPLAPREWMAQQQGGGQF